MPNESLRPVMSTPPPGSAQHLDGEELPFVLLEKLWPDIQSFAGLLAEETARAVKTGHKISRSPQWRWVRTRVRCRPSPTTSVSRGSHRPLLPSSEWK